MHLGRIAVIGAKGQLGHDLIEVLSDHDVIPFTRSVLELCDFRQTQQVLSMVQPAIVINTAAFNQVDAAEDEPAKAFSINTYAVRNLACVCRDLQCILVHLSTDYVFGGETRTPYTEDDLPNPLNVYGVSKLAGEFFVRNIVPKHMIVRTSGLYGVAGSRGKGGNFVDTMVRLSREGRPIRVVHDQVLTPTYTKDLAQKIKELLPTQAPGVYHITNGGECSWYEFARQIFELLGLSPDLAPTTTEVYGSKARRPAYSVLAQTHLRQEGLDALRPWPEALAAYLVGKKYC